MWAIKLTTIHVIAAWSLNYAILVGAGLATRRFFHLKPVISFSFWVGWAITILFLQIWHLFAPANGIPFLVLAIWGGTGLFWARQHIIARLKDVHWSLFLVVPVAAIWLAGQAINNPPFGDDGLYHLQQIKWEKTFAIVPGLANVHSRFGFNNANSLWFAMLDSVEWLPPARHIGSSLLMLAFFLEAIWAGKRLLARTSYWFADYFLVLCIAPVVFMAAGKSAISPKTDSAVLVLGILLAAAVMQILQKMPSNRSEKHYQIFRIALFSALGIAIKLSFAAVAISMSIIALYWFATRYALAPTVKIMSAVFVVFMGVWLFRGVILSGYPLFPSSLVSVPVAWRIPRFQVDDAAEFVTQFARSPDEDGSASLDLGDGDWLGPWWQRNRHRYIEFVIPLGMAGVSIILSGVFAAFHPERGIFRSCYWLVPLAGAVSGVVWFILAPSIRFGLPAFWITGAGSLIATLVGSTRKRWWGSVVIGISGLLTLYVLVEAEWNPYSNGNRFPDVTGFPYRITYTYHGVRLNVGDEGRCWEAPLPCAPGYEAYLRYRDPGNLAAGFVYEITQPDKGVFEWAARGPLPDIVPMEPLEALRSGQMVPNGLVLGDGWHPVEVWDSGYQRWLENDAEVYVTAPDLSRTTIYLEIEPGPSLDFAAFTLYLIDEQDVVISSAHVSGNQIVKFDLPLAPDQRVQVFRLHINRDGVPAASDGRVLNARVTELGWR